MTSCCGRRMTEYLRNFFFFKFDETDFLGVNEKNMKICFTAGGHYLVLTQVFYCQLNSFSFKTREDYITFSCLIFLVFHGFVSSSQGLCIM